MLQVVNRNVIMNTHNCWLNALHSLTYNPTFWTIDLNILIVLSAENLNPEPQISSHKKTTSLNHQTLTPIYINPQSLNPTSSRNLENGLWTGFGFSFSFVWDWDARRIRPCECLHPENHSNIYTLNLIPKPKCYILNPRTYSLQYKPQAHKQNVNVHPLSAL